MKSKIFKHAAIAMVLAGNFTSCTNKMNNDFDPEKAILGKWELVLLTRNMGKDEKQHTPTGYVEYLPNRLMAWYDYTSQKYILLESKWWLEEVDNSDSDNISNKSLILHYKDLWVDIVGDGTGWYLVFPDGHGCDKHQCTFFSNNHMGLYQLCTAPITEDYTFIYNRKK